MAGMAGNGWKWLKWLERVRNSWKWMEMKGYGVDGMAGNGWRWLEMAGKGWERMEWLKPIYMGVRNKNNFFISLLHSPSPSGQFERSTYIDRSYLDGNYY